MRKLYDHLDCVRLPPMTRRRTRGLGLLALAVLLGGAIGTARAQDLPEEQTERNDVAERSAQAGMFLPLTLAPRVDSQAAYVKMFSGYDSARHTALLQGTA